MAAAIVVEGLSKRYELGARRRAAADDPASSSLWALSDVSFEVQVGEVLGIVGRNGAGKTTLLKILSRITSPTSGRATIRGRVSSLLEVGTGFHPELTGRENVYLNGAILGMKRAEIERKFDAIVDFAGVERFLDTPLKRYSSGMQVRLAFAVAAHLDPDVLIVDEVLAVGDHGFQQRSMGKMRDAVRSGRTVLLVTHNMGAMRALAQRALVLHEGKLAAIGNVEEGVGKYLELSGIGGDTHTEVRWTPAEAPGTEALRCYRVSLIGERAQGSGEVLSEQSPVIELEYEALEELANLRFHLTFVTDQGEIAFRVTDHDVRAGALRKGRYVSRCTLPPFLFNQRSYTVLLGAGQPGVRKHLEDVPTVGFNVIASEHGSLYREVWPGVVAPRAQWQIDQPLAASVESPS